jgi:histidinol-phosphate/aromatic aminotransferase/cobyric acid decarboxylase-like protein
MIAGGATLPFYNEPALAQLSKVSAPPDAVLINANENPLGPCKEAREAVANMIQHGGRYRYSEGDKVQEILSEQEGVKGNYVRIFAGSSGPLHQAVLAFTSPTRPFVTCDPGYEAGERAARNFGVPVVRVPLMKDKGYAHDVKAMAAVSGAGLIYVCNPNNPTGSVTRKEDIEYIVTNKPKGCLVLIDEAYIHFSTTASPATDLVSSDKDVIVLRTFSKLYGMAGLRAGAALGRPDLLEKLKGYGGLGIMPATGMAGATASLKEKGLVPERRRILAEIREDLCLWMHKKGYGFIPSEANMVLVDGKRPGRQMAQAMLAQKVAIGRAWPSLPNHVRVTIGTRDEMARFKTAFERVMGS